MRRRLFALVCLLALLWAMVAALAHDHLGASPDRARHHGCIVCSADLAPTEPAPQLAQAAPLPLAIPARAVLPCLESRLDPSHSGNAPPASAIA